ncbi:MAG: hypothetical protein WAQ33_12500 [Gaiellaceae bacterium]
MSDNRPSLTELRADLWRAAEIDDLTERTLEVVAVIEEAAAPLGIHPTLVGGMAVYFWTESDEFLTYDIDVVMAVPDQLALILAQLGFTRSKDGRHWELEGTKVLLEAPGASLDVGAHVTQVKLRSGRTARVLSRVDILLDRLDEFQATDISSSPNRSSSCSPTSRRRRPPTSTPAHHIADSPPSSKPCADLWASCHPAPTRRQLTSCTRSRERPFVPSTLQESHEDANHHPRRVAPRHGPPPRKERRGPRTPWSGQAREAAQSNRG